MSTTTSIIKKLLAVTALTLVLASSTISYASIAEQVDNLLEEMWDFGGTTSDGDQYLYKEFDGEIIYAIIQIDEGSAEGGVIEFTNVEP